MMRNVRFFFCPLKICFTGVLFSLIFFCGTSHATEMMPPRQEQKATFIPYVPGNLLFSQGKTILYGLTALIGVGICLKSYFMSMVGGALLIFSFYFFRNPERRYTPPTALLSSESSPLSEGMPVLSPADGKVLEIVYEEDLFVGQAVRVCIFLSPLDVHVQWMPVAGLIRNIVYRPGTFIVAYAPKSSDLNERNDIWIQTADGMHRVVVRQVAGFIARRICCWVTAGTHMNAGEKYGMIRFGSQVNIILPRDVARVQVKVGDRVYGGATEIGRLYEHGQVSVS